MANKYGKKLGKLNKNWKQTKNDFGDSTGGFETIPSGNYVIGKIKCELDEDANGLLLIKRESEVLEGDHAGFILKDRINLDPSVSPRAQEFLLKWLNLLGYQVDSLEEDLEATLDEINDNASATFKATIKEKDGFNNVYFNAVLDEGEGLSDDDSSDDDSSDDDTSNSTRDEIPDIDSMKTRQLKKLVKDENLDVDLSGSPEDDDIRDMIETAWDKPSVEDAPEPEPEKAVSKRTSRKTAKEDSGDAKLKKGLFDLGDGFGIADVSEDDDFDTLKKVLGDYTFPKKELEAKEIKLLKDCGLEKTIK